MKTRDRIGNIGGWLDYRKEYQKIVERDLDSHGSSGETLDATVDDSTLAWDGPCNKCKFLKGTFSVEDDCPCGNTKCTFKVTFTATYHEECVCKDLSAMGLDAVCGCSKSVVYDAVPDNRGNRDFCIYLGYSPAGECKETIQTPKIGGWSQNCRDSFFKELGEFNTSFKFRCQPAGGGFNWGEAMSRAAIRTIVNWVSVTANAPPPWNTIGGNPIVTDLMDQDDNCDCTKLFGSGD